MFNILELIPSPPKIKVVDIGAMSIGEGTEPYYALMELGLVDIIGFEPIVEECEKLNSTAPANYTYLPYFIGDGSTKTFYECNYPMTSSLYEPNTSILDRFQNLENLVRVVRKENVQTKRLDEIPEVRNADLIKIDVQGGELDVLRGAKNTIINTSLIHTEIEFLPLYKNQPLFAEIDQKLRQNGYYFHKFASLQGRMFKPLVDIQDINTWISQPLWGDAVYINHMLDFDSISNDNIIKLVVMLHIIYRSYDLCCALLEEYDRRNGGDLGKRYLDRLIDTNK